LTWIAANSAIAALSLSFDFEMMQLLRRKGGTQWRCLALLRSIPTALALGDDVPLLCDFFAVGGELVGAVKQNVPCAQALQCGSITRPAFLVKRPAFLVNKPV
jgi:hypothetical protein